VLSFEEKKAVSHSSFIFVQFLTEMATFIDGQGINETTLIDALVLGGSFVGRFKLFQHIQHVSTDSFGYGNEGKFSPRCLL
jgi:hypothetical protein